ncbi:hypothetical protein [Jiella sp. M17.18]|uniref:hypothetical protein n=1 Tax=Jiella sp. M17.18 TaxID=3234247 RepID=UPI0034DF2973
MFARMMFRAAGTVVVGAPALCVAMVLSQPGFAQDGAQPRAIPKGFVLPGPAPKNAPNWKPGGAPQRSPGAAATQEAAPAEPPGASQAPAVTSQGGAMVPAPTTVVGPGETAAASPMAFARGPQKGTTNWPCAQRLVDTITPAQIWAGPDLSQAKDVPRTPAMQALVDEVVVRRLPLDEAEAKVKEFVTSLPKGERAAKTTAIFTDILARLNAERNDVVNGIERYGAKQKAMAARIRKESAEINAQQRATTTVPTEPDQARQQIMWDTRIFDERRKSLGYVCEVPTLIEQRAFGLGRALQQAL